MSEFKIQSDFKPQGDQAQAIEGLVQGLNNGDKHQVLLGITGSGKTFTMANVIQEVQRPTLIISHNSNNSSLIMQLNFLLVIMTIINRKLICPLQIRLLKKTCL